MEQAVAESGNVSFFDAHPAQGDYRSEIIAGLSSEPKTVNPKWFYDKRGSELFAEITEQPEYYPTRTETALLEQHRAAISERCGRGCVFIEPGSGNCEKARLLLDELAPTAYVPIDISASFLRQAAQDLGRDYAWLPVNAICADFNDFDSFESHLPAGKRVVFYPGSTIGNLEPDAANTFLRSVRDLIGADGGMLVGVDLHKGTSRLDAAYNDSAGVTAAFNLNMLTHVNRLLEGNFKEDAFSHRAFYNEKEQRIEMHLVSRVEQSVHCAGHTFQFRAGETLHTESSYKYTVEGFTRLAADAGLNVQESWIDPERLFSLHYLSP